MAVFSLSQPHLNDAFVTFMGLHNSIFARLCAARTTSLRGFAVGARAGTLLTGTSLLPWRRQPAVPVLAASACGLQSR